MSFDSKALRDRYLTLDQQGHIQAEYIWISADYCLRSKCRTVDFIPSDASELPVWNFDGSSTGQAPGNDSEILLTPRKIYRDPFRRGDNILVICDCYKPDGTPALFNNRAWAASIFEQCAEEHPWFGIEQEYTLLDKDGWPLGFPKGGYPEPQGKYYCSVGTGCAIGRDIVESHYRACLFAGVKIAGVNLEVMPGQHEFQVGPCESLDSGDDLWVARYLLHRVAEDFDVIVTIDPKPMKGEWNGAGCHTNFSTKAMREDEEMKACLEAIDRLSRTHAEHMKVYGEGNEQRMTGRLETSSYDTFSFGVANRGASIRIPRTTDAAGRGYIEDRRPASNIDPYLVSGIIAKTVCL